MDSNTWKNINLRTTLFECETLQRNYIGFDINDDIIRYVQNKMTDCNVIQ